MVKSMTGYGRTRQTISGKDILVEIKSVNHRYFDFSCRVPRSLGFLEEKLKSFLSAAISRGKVDVYVTIDFGESDEVTVNANIPLFNSYAAAIDSLAKVSGITDDRSLMRMALLPDVLSVHKQETDAQKLWEEVSGVLSEAVADFENMRITEGQRLYDDMNSRGYEIVRMVKEIERLAPSMEEEYAKRLQSRIEEWVGALEIDKGRILTEIAIFADKVCIAEEIVRLQSHMKQFFSMLQSNEPVGRKLDFLIQEMNREANTIGSKSCSGDITKLVISIKSEIEKIREQAQNIE